MRDVFDHCEELDLRDFRLLKIGRHCRIGERTKVIIGRDESDNNLLETARQAGEAAITWLDGNTPVGVIAGRQGQEHIELASRILLRYTRAETGASCRISVRQNDSENIITVTNNLTPSDVERYVVA